MLVWVCSCEIATLLEITCHGSYGLRLFFSAYTLNTQHATLSQQQTWKSNESIHVILICTRSDKYMCWSYRIWLNVPQIKWTVAWDFQQFGMCTQQRLRPAYAYAQTDQSLCWSLKYSMTVKLLTERHLRCLSLKGGCTGSSESTHVKVSNCWKSHSVAHIYLMALTSSNR